MKKILKLLTILGVCVLFLTTNLVASEKLDEETGLVVDEGLELVKDNCIICHPARLMLINGGDKKFWAGKLKLMQKGFGLCDLEKADEESIINYLSKHYPSKQKISIH